MKKEQLRTIRNENDKPRLKLYIGTPTLGIIRTEWAIARFGQVIPCNWSVTGSNYGFTHTFPTGYLVADAQNMAVADAIANNAEWLLLLEDDVVCPPDLFLRLNEYMRKEDVPVVSGLYFTKGMPSEPLVYRGRGNSYFTKWKMKDKVWVDGVPTGCLLIHMSIIRLMSEESKEYMTSAGRAVRQVFETPRKVWTDPETQMSCSAQGTSDLYWCDRVMKEKVLDKAGWHKIAKLRYPFLVDTNIFCKHIDLSTGRQYP